ncbi:MAG: signal peptidase I [Lachnospiraceae bacterium]|nr:signal peptidase I [Lachnospiraceae bacterium]
MSASTKRKVEKGIRSLFGTIVYLAVVFAVTFLFIIFIAQRTDVDGKSMENTLHHGDALIVDKISYRFHDPKRFDIIVFPFRYADKVLYIKRIIGLPGETVQIDNDGHIYINGEILVESYGKEVIKNPGRAIEPITLGKDEYFVMGDNRNNSSDGRDPAVGNISRDTIIGRAFLRIYPFDSFGFVK